MSIIISNLEITQTKAYEKLEKVFQQMVLKLPNKKIISNGLVVFKSTGVIPSSISGNNKKILLDIIDAQT